MGRPTDPRNPHTKYLSAYVHPELHQRAREFAQSHGVRMSDILRAVFRDAFWALEKRCAEGKCIHPDYCETRELLARERNERI